MADFKINIVTDASQTIAASQQTAAALGGVTAATNQAGQAMVQTAASTAKATSAKEALKQAAKGIATEFPIVGKVAQLAMNPISAAVAGITAAFSIWNWRMREAENVLAGMRLPDGVIEVDRITSSAQAWEHYSAALKKTVEDFDSVNNKFAQTLALMDAAQKRADQMADSAAKRDQAKAKAAGATDAQLAVMSADQVAQQKARDLANRQQSLNAEVNKAGEQAGEAQHKLGEAMGISVMTETQDNQLGARYEENKKAAEKAQAEAKARKEQIEKYRAGELGLGEKFAFAKDFYMQYGLSLTGSEAIQLENQNIGQAQTAIDQADDFASRRGERDKRRKRKSDLVSEAATGENEAINAFYGDLQTKQQNLDADKLAAGLVASNEQLAILYTALANSNQARDQILNQMQDAVSRGTGVAADLFNKQQQVNSDIELLRRRISSLESSRGNNPSGL